MTSQRTRFLPTWFITFLFPLGLASLLLNVIALSNIGLANDCARPVAEHCGTLPNSEVWQLAWLVASFITVVVLAIAVGIYQAFAGTPYLPFGFRLSTVTATICITIPLSIVLYHHHGLDWLMFAHIGPHPTRAAAVSASGWLFSSEVAFFAASCVMGLLLFAADYVGTLRGHTLSA